MKQHNFYFRCRACNRYLKNHSRKDKSGVIQESDLCSICTGSAFDDSPERVYHHQYITDLLLPSLGSSDEEADFN
ncbi:hypothetical protein [Citrobacter phage Tr1]|nr:hypothetical protein [Citrobacter phage Tr1]